METLPVPLTRITPPRNSARILPRPRIQRALEEALDYRVTILQAGAGYGKSTAIAALAEQQRVIWYQVTKGDTDRYVFLLHLLHATRQAFPELEGLPLALLESWDGARGPIPVSNLVNRYINALNTGLSEPALLVLDDIHLAARQPEIVEILDQLIGLAPHQLHLVLASREALKLPGQTGWQARGQLLAIDQSVLAFTEQEILELYTKQFHHDLSPREAEQLFDLTEGWAITLHLIWQSLRSGASHSVAEALSRQATSLDSLFDVLAQEVLAQQPPELQEFMVMSATFRVMTAEACDALWKPGNSRAMLDRLYRQDLFVFDLGAGSSRYHHVFHRFLREQADERQRRRWHTRAARYFQSANDQAEAVYHSLKAQDHAAAAELLVDYGAQLLAVGRLGTLSDYLNELQPEVLHEHPTLQLYLGDLARLHSQYQEALGWYQQAEALWRDRGQMEEVGRALRGQARIYLDTVNPSEAEKLLQQALRLSDETTDRDTLARLYELLAENKLNSGRGEQAEDLRRQAERLRQEGPSDSQLLIRVLLRTGRLSEARRELEALAEIEQQVPVSTPRSHRETQLLLSIIYAFQGEPEAAHYAALKGTERGEELHSPFVTAVGHLRQGHALMMLDRYDEAIGQFEQAIAIGRKLATRRLQIEAFWGLCRAYGYRGELAEAERLAQEGIEIADRVGDEWIASVIRVTMGANLTLAGRYSGAQAWLAQALRGFQECSDPFGAAAADLWRCLGWHRQGDLDQLASVLSDLLGSCRKHGYDFLFVRPTLLGSPDERMLVPLVVYARERGWQPAYAARLLEAVGLPRIQHHPGYQLKVIALGSFQAWRGRQSIAQNGWRREKARHLFQLLLTQREAPLERDQICEQLWPGIDAETGHRNFKVALSTLYNVLEPDRSPSSESAYISRQGSIYGLRPGADLWFDASEFTRLVRLAEDSQGQESIQALERAIELYQGEYLPDARYESWAALEREHLAVLFLAAADRYSEWLLEQERHDQLVVLSQRVLTHDDCWERAYRYLMLAHHRLGNHGQIARSYEKCVETLRAELDVSPSEETSTLFARLVESA